MNVFISHSWKDKTAADILAHDLDTVCDNIWLQAQQCTSAYLNQPVNEQLIHACDIVIILWSQNSIRDEKISALITTDRHDISQKFLVCLYDNTPPPVTLAQLMLIDFSEYGKGLGQLSLLFLQQATSNTFLLSKNEFSKIKNITESISHIDNYKNLIAQANSPVINNLASLTKSLEKVHALLTKLDENLSACNNSTQEIYTYLHEAGNNREKLQNLINMTIQAECLEPTLSLYLRGMIERHINSLPTPMGFHAPQSLHMDFLVTPDVFQQALTHADKEKAEIEQVLQSFISAAILPDITETVHYYIVSSQDVFGLLHDIIFTSESQGSFSVLQQLCQYLQGQSNLHHESNYNTWELADDAWLIHNTAYRLVESRLIAAEMLPFDWDKIATADNVIVRCLPQLIIHQLETQLMQFMKIIALEVTQYVPCFSVGPRDYHPRMGHAHAVGVHDDTLESRIEKLFTNSARLRA